MVLRRGSWKMRFLVLWNKVMKEMCLLWRCQARSKNDRKKSDTTIRLRLPIILWPILRSLWRIVPFSNWLISMVIVSPQDLGLFFPLPNGIFIWGLDPNYLHPLGWSSKYLQVFFFHQEVTLPKTASLPAFCSQKETGLSSNHPFFRKIS